MWHCVTFTRTSLWRPPAPMATNASPLSADIGKQEHKAGGSLYFAKRSHRCSCHICLSPFCNFQVCMYVTHVTVSKYWLHMLCLWFLLPGSRAGYLISDKMIHNNGHRNSGEETDCRSQRRNWIRIQDILCRERPIARILDKEVLVSHNFWKLSRRQHKHQQTHGSWWWRTRVILDQRTHFFTHEAPVTRTLS